MPIRKIATYTLLAIAGFFLLIILFAITSSVDDSLSDTEPMTATVKILPGAIEVINEDTFPWHGLIITIHNRYSTKYRFGDFNWGFLSEDSVLQPSEDTSPSINAFIDRNGTQFEGPVYTIIAGKVELEARTLADGPYDLKATFNFTSDDPIVNHGIIRTNKPVDSGSGVHATPYALEEEVERLPTLRIFMENTPINWWVEHHEPNYQGIKTFVSDYPQDAFGAYLLPREAYEELEAKFAPERAVERESNRRTEEMKLHWGNIEAFQASMKEINADHVIDQGESEHVCFTLDQWTAQMEEAQAYAQEFLKAVPAGGAYPSIISSIEEEAERALKLLAAVECQ